MKTPKSKQGYQLFFGNIITEEELISCPLCGRLFEHIRQDHLRSHGFRSLKEFQLTYPGTPTITKKRAQFINEQKSEKMRSSCREKYGVEYALQRPESMEKFRTTCLHRLGVEYPSQNEKIKKLKAEKQHEKLIEKIPNLLHYLDLELIGNLSHAKNCETFFKCLKCGTAFQSRWNTIQQGRRCPRCYENDKSSRFHLDVMQFIQDLGCECIINDRNTIKPSELDIVIPDKFVAIECHGLYWHSEAVRATIARTIHLEKLERCLVRGIRLIQIFEDEWVFKKDVVRSRIAQILQESKASRIHARKCRISEIDGASKNEFLEKFHLQGADRSKVKLGAFFRDRLVAVMTFSCSNPAKGSRHRRGVWELNRFCTDNTVRVPGIASKMLRFFELNYPWVEIFSYADRRWSQGEMYFNLGFHLDSFTPINYWYVKGPQRIHRFNLRKKPDEPRDVPERILRMREGYTRVWDCGHLKFRKQYQPTKDSTD